MRFWCEIMVAQQAVELFRRERAADAEGRIVRARPQPLPIGRNNENAAFGGQYPPSLFHQRIKPRFRFDGMRQDQTIHEAIW